MNTAQKIYQKWNVCQAEFARRFGISDKTAARWLNGGQPKDVGLRLLEIADNDNSFYLQFPMSKTIRSEHETAQSWIKAVMRKCGDTCLNQFARRLGIRFDTVRAWYHSESKYLHGSAEALLLYAYIKPHSFPKK